MMDLRVMISRSERFINLLSLSMILSIFSHIYHSSVRGFKTKLIRYYNDSSGNEICDN